MSNTLNIFLLVEMPGSRHTTLLIEHKTFCNFLLCHFQIIKKDKKYWFEQGKMLSNLSVLRNVLPLMRKKDGAKEMYNLFQQSIDGGQLCPQSLARHFSEDMAQQDNKGK